MHTEMSLGGASSNALSMKLSSLQPKKRASNRTKFSARYQDIVAAIERGVSMKDIRDATLPSLKDGNGDHSYE